MNTSLRRLGPVIAILTLTGCGTWQRLTEVGGPPRMTPITNPTQAPGYRPISMPMPPPPQSPLGSDSLWQPGSRAFFMDQRAARVGDLITVVVAMNDAANFKNVTGTARDSNEDFGMPNLFGLENLMKRVPMDPSKLIAINSDNANKGNGQIQRNETVTLRLAGVVSQVLPNGNLVVTASQEFRVNSELRVLQVSGIVRPQDIASDNTVQHDRMAEARIAYGGRGQLTELQTPRWGQQTMDILLPF
ncbi:MAG TPA: flagellar basal body L-ring protein FlgH [Acetobacteraceae bacterium]|nr:flagellar basal body L-ring protein FlgH [Acetobacteraceae bacterium]